MGFNENPMFSWSSSREKMLKDCELCYIMHYYTSHNGWLSSSNAHSKSNYRWKQAHKVEELLLKSTTEALVDRAYGKIKKLKDVQDTVLKDLNAAYIDSTKNKEEWYKNPKKTSMLYELVYSDKLAPDAINEAKNKLDICIQNFKRSQLAKELADSEIIPVREKFKNNFSFYTHEMNFRVYASVQVVHKRKDGKIIVTNFKTSDDISTLSSLGPLAKIVSESTGESLENIIIRDEYLLTGKNIEYPFSSSLMKKSDNAIRKSIALMADLLVNGDIQKNEFLGYRDAVYTRAIAHHDAQRDDVDMDVCPYCEAVRRDLTLYPNGYESNKLVLETETA